jgi:hypothetical protein
MEEVHYNLPAVPLGKNKILTGQTHVVMEKTELSISRRGELYVHICPTTGDSPFAAPLCI